MKKDGAEILRVVGEGQVPTDWRRSTVLELLEEGSIELVQDGNHGGNYPKSDEFCSIGIPLITGADIADGAIDLRGCKFLKPDSAARLKIGFAKTGDVLLSHKGTMGKTALIPILATPYVVLNPQLTLYRMNEVGALDRRYLKYFFDSPQFQGFLNRVSGISTISSLSLTVQKSIEICFPSKPEQRSIAGVLGALDDKIESNRRTSRTLERLARAIFRAWFVDFEPVKAKAAGARSFPGMPQEAFEALPTRLVSSELGPIPEGWEVKALSDAFDVNPARTLRKSECAPYLEMKGMPTSGHAPEAWVDRPFGSGMRFMNGDTLVARITPCLENGKTAFVDFLSNGQIAWGSTEYIVLRPKPPVPPIFAYCLARTDEFRDFAIQNMTGTSGRQRVAPTVMDHFHIALPRDHVVGPFGETVQPMFNRIRACMNESRKLAALRDYLLPRLLSGDVRVEETKQAVGSSD